MDERTSRFVRRLGITLLGIALLYGFKDGTLLNYFTIVVKKTSNLLMEMVFLLLILLFVPLRGPCPYDWPFESCPRPGTDDTDSHVVCCFLFGGQHSCCTVNSFRLLGIALVCVIAAGLFIITCLSYHLCRRCGKRSSRHRRFRSNSSLPNT
ncbi:uncharacterized protein LOC144447690 [Glandiceps talaboti]